MKNQSVVDAKAFSNALAQVSKVLRKGTFPALEEVLICFSSEHCTLTATDLETWLITEIPACGDVFSFTFRQTKDVAKACRLFDGELSIELTDVGEEKERTLTICMRCGNRTGEFDAMAPEDYPTHGKIDAQVSFQTDAAKLLGRIERVSYAAEKPASSTPVNRCSVQFSGNHVFALDGYRLSCDTDEALAFPRPFMVLKDALSHLKLFGNQEITVELGERGGVATDGRSTLMFRIHGIDVYPVESARPNEFRETLLASPKELLQELKYLKEFTVNERKPYVRFHEGKLVMPLVRGKYKTSVDISGRNEIVFAFELQKMIDAVEQFKNEPQIRILLQSPVSPFIIEAEGRKDYALVCPVRLSEQLMAA